MFNPAARAKAALRAEVARTVGFDPIERYGADLNLVELAMRMIAQASTRAEGYAAEIRRLVTESPNLRDALVGDIEGEWGKAGEYIRGIAILEAAERDRIMSWTFKALAVGVEAKRVELAASHGSQLAQVLTAALSHPALGLSPEQRAAFPAVVREVLGIGG